VARLVDCKWRADHVISSSENGAASQSNQFHITWKTAASAAARAGIGGGETGGDEIKFTCNLEQVGAVQVESS
jgi:hypothetical protein